MLWLAWAGLHLLLLGAATAAALPWTAWTGVVLAVLVHAFGRRPELAPPLLALTPDGSWYSAGHGLSPFALGPGSVLAPYWLRLDLRSASARLNIVLVRDQIDEETWRRLSAVLRRATSAAPRA